MRLVLLIILVLLVLGALPTWPYSAGLGYYPSGRLALVLLILLLLPLLRRIQRPQLGFRRRWRLELVSQLIRAFNRINHGTVCARYLAAQASRPPAAQFSFPRGCLGFFPRRSGFTSFASRRLASFPSHCGLSKTGDKGKREHSAAR